MQSSSGSVFIPLVAAVLLAVYTRHSHQQAIRRGDRLTEGYYRGQGLAWGLACGLALDAAISVYTGNTTWGILGGVSIGLVLGLAAGMLAEKRHEGELRPLSSDERDTRRFVLLLGLGAVVLGLLAILGILWMSR